MAVDRRTRGHSFKLVLARCKLEMRKSFSDEKVIQRCNASSEHAVMQITLSAFKRLLHLR